MGEEGGKFRGSKGSTEKELQMKNVKKKKKRDEGRKYHLTCRCICVKERRMSEKTKPKGKKEAKGGG